MTMKIYAYAVIDSSDKIKGPLSGTEGAGIYSIPYRDVGIAASDIIDECLFSSAVKDIGAGPAKDRALTHEKVIESLMENFTVLPFRCFTVFNGKEDVLSMAEKYYSGFKDNLERLYNKLEFGIKVIWPGDIIRERIMRSRGKNNGLTSISSPVKNFVKEKLERYNIDKEFEEEADRCIEAVDDLFSRFYVEKKLERLKTNKLLLSAFYLVDKEKEDDFKRLFEELKNSPGDLKYLFSGPWPPYNFIHLTPYPEKVFGAAQEMFDKGASAQRVERRLMRLRP